MDVAKQQMKRTRASKLAGVTDILVLQETHSNRGKCEGLRMPKGVRPFWSHGGAGQAGVGAWVKEAFLAKFDKHELIHIVHGRAAILRCWGAQGKLQVGMVYLHTGNSGGRRERTDSMRNMIRELVKWGASPNHPHWRLQLCGG